MAAQGVVSGGTPLVVRSRIPEAAVDRLSAYHDALRRLSERGHDTIVSPQLADAAGVSAAQVRKDLAYFGRYGRQGIGYRAQPLLDELSRILGLNRDWPMLLVGVGHLGQAIASYGGFERNGFRLVAAYDVDPAVIGLRLNGLLVRDARELPRDLHASPVRIAIIAVPTASAQEVAENLVECGVSSILNYTPAALHVPDEVRVRQIDPLRSLKSMTYHLQRAASGEPGKSEEVDRAATGGG